MRTHEETARHMIKRYGKDALIHCLYAIMNNEGSHTAAYWREVYNEIRKQEKRNAYPQIR